MTNIPSALSGLTRHARDRVNHEHRSIVAALRSGDVDRAVRELDEHRGHAIAALTERLDD